MSSNKNNSAAPKQDKDLKEVIDTKSCVCCGKFGGNDSMMRCSRCKSANYCSKECQIKHWKEHKPRCIKVQENKKVAAQHDSKREFRLLQEWKDQVKDALLGYLMVSHFGVAQLKEIRKEKMLIQMPIDFDYNRRTFLPSMNEPAELLPPPSTLQQINPTLAQAAIDQYAKCEERIATMKEDAGAYVVMIQYKGTVSIMPNLIMDVSKMKKPTHGTSWKDIVQNMFTTVTLQSSVFDSWIPLQQQNVKTQLLLVRQSPHYQPFIVNALRILTTKPQHKSHIVMIQMEMGMGLGEIVKLTDYQVWTLEKVKKELRKQVPPAMYEQYVGMLDVENHPQLLASRVARPHNVLLPILFIGKPMVHISPELMELHPDHEINKSQKASASKAHEKFAALTKISFPKVTSPELH